MKIQFKEKVLPAVNCDLLLALHDRHMGMADLIKQFFPGGAPFADRLLEYDRCKVRELKEDKVRYYEREYPVVTLLVHLLNQQDGMVAAIIKHLSAGDEEARKELETFYLDRVAVANEKHKEELFASYGAVDVDIKGQGIHI